MIEYKINRHGKSKPNSKHEVTISCKTEKKIRDKLDFYMKKLKMKNRSELIRRGIRMYIRYLEKKYGSER